MDTIEIEATLRQVTGKKVKALRRAGITPLHLYGKAMESLALQAESREVARTIAQAGKNTPVSVRIDGQGEKNIAFIREVQRDPVTDKIIHVDFLSVELTERIKAEVPVVAIGEAPAVRLSNGVLIQVIHSLTVEALPMEMPQSLEVDVSELDNFEKAIRVRDLTIPPGASIVAEPDEMIVRVNPPRVEVEEEEVVEEAPTEAEAEAERPAGEEAPEETTKQ